MCSPLNRATQAKRCFGDIATVNTFFIDGASAFVEIPFYAGGTVDCWFNEQRNALVRTRAEEQMQSVRKE